MKLLGPGVDRVGQPSVGLIAPWASCSSIGRERHVPCACPPPIGRPLLRASSALVENVLWSDPTQSDSRAHWGVHGSPRGGGIKRFGADVTHRFCQRNHIQVVLGKDGGKDEDGAQPGPSACIAHARLSARTAASRSRRVCRW